MTARFAALLILTLQASFQCLTSAQEAHSTVTVVWNSEVRSPGICVDKPTWFISVIPASLPLEGLTKATLQVDGESIETRVVFLDGSERLCLLETAAPITGLTPAPLALADDLKGGQKLNCLSKRSACLTTVAGKDWSHRGEQFQMPMLRVRVANPEEFCAAGTPLVCEQGKLVGILIGNHLDDSGEGHAIPVARVRKLLVDVKMHKRSGPVRVGLVFHNQSSTPEVVDVKPGSPAERSGLEVGDVILSIDGTETESLDDLVEVIHHLPAGTETPLRVLRGLSEKNLTIIPEFAEMTAAAR